MKQVIIKTISRRSRMVLSCTFVTRETIEEILEVISEAEKNPKLKFVLFEYEIRESK